jgi:hypothetical protein
MALAGVAGLGLGVDSGGFGTVRAASPDYLAIDGSNSMNARLDMGGFSVENVDDVLANAQYSSHSTRGTETTSSSSGTGPTITTSSAPARVAP